MVEQQQQILDKQRQMLEQQRQMLEQKPFGQIETMQKQDDTTGVGESLHQLHEKVDSQRDFCKMVDKKIQNNDEHFKLVEA